MKIPIIADIHFNNENALRIYDELKSIFLPHVEGSDAVIIAGDITDCKVQFDSITAKIVMKFLNDIRRLLSEDSPILLLKGTKTHDYNIVDTFSDTIDGLYCISTKEPVELGDCNILLLPEEYPKDWRDYYKDVLNIDLQEDYDKYDLIAFHGMVDWAAHPSCIIESERQIHSSVVFPSEVLMASSKICIGGHVHNMDDYKSIHYCKSFSRLSFGEEEDKGFIIWKGGKKFERIVNDKAPTYQTILLEDYYDPEKDSIDSLAESIDDFLGQDKYSHLRIRVTTENISDKLHSDILILREKYSDEPRIKVDMSHSFNKKKKKDEIEEKTDEIIHESVVNNEPIESTIKKFAKEKFNFDIKEEDVINIISK